MKQLTTLFLILFLIGTNGMLKAQDVKINNNFVIETDGTFRLENNATVWDDIMVFPDATSKGGSKAPVWGGVSGTAFKKTGSSQGVFLWMFSASTEQELYFTVQIPHGYKVGSDLYPHVHWTTASGTPSGSNVSWGLEYTVTPMGGTFTNTTIITTNSLAPIIGTPTGTGQHLISEFGSISGANFGISTILVCRLYRNTTDPSDTFSNEVGLLGFDIHYEKDMVGSRTQYDK